MEWVWWCRCNMTWLSLVTLSFHLLLFFFFFKFYFWDSGEAIMGCELWPINGNAKEMTNEHHGPVAHCENDKTHNVCHFYKPNKLECPRLKWLYSLHMYSATNTMLPPPLMITPSHQLYFGHNYLMLKTNICKGP